MKKYNLVDGFYSGIKNVFPGSGYLDFHKNNLFVLSARGVLGYISMDNIKDQNYLKQVENNIDDFLGLKQHKKTHTLSLKDLLIYGNKIYVSYTEELQEDCWNTSVIHGNISYESIKFEKLFSSEECLNYDDIPEFEFHQTGGRIAQFDNDNVLLTVGEYRARSLAQDKNSINGKTVKININNFDYEIISMGHRNSQGMYVDQKNGFIVQTEHGPRGGDEINIIEIEKIDNKKILNYGWPISSYGDHYSSSSPGQKEKKSSEKYKKYPLYKSHVKYGFIEPLKYFFPSIGISEITKISNDKYVVGSLRDQSLYFFEMNNKIDEIGVNFMYRKLGLVLYPER